MKNVLSILLLCLIFQNVLTSRRSLKMRMAKAAEALKVISQNTEDAIDTEAGDENSTDTSVQTTLPNDEYKDDSQVDAPESANATASNAPVPVDKPVATKPKTKGNSNAAVHVIKFHGFKGPATRGPGKVTFGAYIYFFGRPIVKFFVMRLRITYNRGLRNLQEAIAESARTDCELIDPSLAGLTLSEDEGKNVNYNCEADATRGDASTANFILNTDIPITMVNANGTAETLDFAEVNFDGNAAEESTNLQTNMVTISGSYILKVASLEFDKQILIFTGEISSRRRLRNLALANGEIIQMTLIDNLNEGNKYDCTINDVSSSSSTLECDTSRNPIRTTAVKLNLNAGTTKDNQTLFTIKMSDSILTDSSIVTPSDGEQTDESNDNITYVEPTAEEYDNSTNSTQAETGSATAQDATVNADKPVSSKGQKIDERDKTVQIMKFHSFKDQISQNGIRTISFGSFFYFIGIRIPYSIIFRIRINYNSRLRNLQIGTADSLRTDCIIANESLYGTNDSDGINANYLCSANPTTNGSISKVQLNTDFDLALAGKNGAVETFNFDLVSFTGTSSEESMNIQTNTDQLNGGITTISNAIAAIQNYNLVISGNVSESSRRLRRLALKDGDRVSMNLRTNSNGESIIKKYDCVYRDTIPGLLCSTSGNPINTTVSNLHLSTGNSSDDTFVLIKMKDRLSNDTALLASGQNKLTYNKSSSGLNGGAIAGIVIACVVALVAALIAVIMFRKPTPPVDKTTIVDLKNATT